MAQPLKDISFRSVLVRDISGPFSRFMLVLIFALIVLGLSGMLSLRWMIAHNIRKSSADNYAKFIAARIGELAGGLDSTEYWEFSINGISDILTPAARMSGVDGIQVKRNDGELVLGTPGTYDTTLGKAPIRFDQKTLGWVYVSLTPQKTGEPLGSLGFMTVAHLSGLTARNYGTLISNQILLLHKELPEPAYWKYETNKLILILSNAMHLEGLYKIVILDNQGNMVAQKERGKGGDYGADIQTDIVHNNSIIGKVHVFIDFPGIERITRMFQAAFLMILAIAGIIIYFIPIRVVKQLERSLVTLNADLERKVEARTAQLSQANEALRTELTQRKKLETSLLRSEKMSAVGQLAAGVAHEINNPLGIILGFAQSVVKKTRDTDPLSVPLKTIEREAVRCKNLVQSLLVFSRTSDETQRTSIDIAVLINDCLYLVSARARTANVEVSVETADALPQIAVNKNQIQQVIINLANNAIDAMPKGGTITIKTALSAGRPDQLEIQIADTGTGIPKSIQPRIFDPFFTTKDVGKGTGMGLSLVYGIVQKHKGAIEVNSEEGKGAVFTVLLPINSGTQAS